MVSVVACPGLSMSRSEVVVNSHWMKHRDSAGMQRAGLVVVSPVVVGERRNAAVEAQLALGQNERLACVPDMVVAQVGYTVVEENGSLAGVVVGCMVSMVVNAAWAHSKSILGLPCFSLCWTRERTG